MSEIWKPIKGFEGYYEVSNLKEIRSTYRKIHKCDGRITTYKSKKRILMDDSHGYLSCVLWMNGKHKNVKLHRLLAEAFIPNPKNKPCVNHKDGNKRNNDLTNLEWCSYSENNQHAYKFGLKVCHKNLNRGKRKLTFEQAQEIRFLYKNNISIYTIAKQFNVDSKIISMIVNMKTYLD